MSETNSSESDLNLLLCCIDNGRFKSLIESLSVDNTCLNCKSFNEKKDSQYRCRVMGSCIGATLSKDLLSYMLWKIELKTQKEHMAALET